MKRHSARAVGAAVLSFVLVAAGCGSTEPVVEVVEDVVFHESLGVDLGEMTRTSSGLYYVDLVEGDGAEAVSGADVAVDYRVRLRTGAFVDSSEGRGPFEFTIDAGGVYAGFNEGVRGMRVGGERKLVLPPALVNDPSLAGLILVFDVELVEVVAP